jgi:hypothetical protein
MLKKLYAYIVKSGAMPRNEIRSFLVSQYKRDWDALNDESFKNKLANPELWASNAKSILDELDATHIKEPKTLKHNKRANKDYPEYNVYRGEPHYSWAFQGVTLRAKENPFLPLVAPKTAELTGSFKPDMTLEVTKAAA